MFRKSPAPFQIFLVGLIDRLVFRAKIIALDVTEIGLVIPQLSESTGSIGSFGPNHYGCWSGARCL